MSGRPSVLVSLDGRVHDPGRPFLFADELAALRGDGVFETLLVRDGRACLVDAHLRRLVRSAALMDLPEPDVSAWRRAMDIAVGEWNGLTGDEGALRLIYSRGREAGGGVGVGDDSSGVTAYLTVKPVPARSVAARRDGVAALLLDRGLAAGGAGIRSVADLPWLLAGAKTLSYAVNMAALRHAASAGADDVIFVSSDGYILEGPRSTVVIATGDAERPRLLTPPTSHPILRGTTQQALFDVASGKGYDCAYEPVTAVDLFAALGVWLISSMTLAARVHTLDGRALPTDVMAREFGALVDAAVSG